MAEMFPTVPGRIPVQAAEEIGRVPAFDSGTSRFLLVDGALVERTGREAVRQWFDLMLRQRLEPGAHLYDGGRGGWDRRGPADDRQQTALRPDRGGDRAQCAETSFCARRCGRYGILR